MSLTSTSSRSLLPSLVPGQRLRILVVDDSVVIRRLITRMLESDPLFDVIGAARNGLDALAKVEQLRPDLVTLDIEMPEMDGLEALRLIQKRHPRVRVIMCSSLTERGATATIDALLAGASDYVTKQHSGDMSMNAYEDLKTDLTAKIRQIFAVPGGIGSPVIRTAPTKTSVTDLPKITPSKSVQPNASHGSFRAKKPEILIIGVSTGGPSALAEILPMVPPGFSLPIAIVQHMPPLFTQLLAERLTKLSRIPIYEAKRGMHLEPGMAILAPGDFHMKLVRRGVSIQVELNQEERENSCRPAVDVLFRSVADIYGGAVMAVILTGMGQDGLLGVRRLKSEGATVIAQDRATSVVWGMPGAVADASLADSILPLHEIIPTIVRRI